MIGLVEGAKRQKTPNEIALHVLLCGHDDHLPDRLRDAGAVRPLLGAALLGDGDRGAAGLPDPDHDRRPALRHRHRRHGPPDPPQRDPDERPRRRGRRRRRHDPARQDRHDHARQPHGDASSCRPRACGSRSWPTPRSSRASPTRRPRAARSWCSPRSATACAGASCSTPEAQVRAVLGADAHERLRPRRARRSARARPTPSRRHVAALGGRLPAEVDQARRGDREVRRHAARRRRRRARARRRAPEGHRQGRAQGALRALPRHGPAHGHDHRRQPAHRRGDRRRGRRRRLPGRGHAGDEAAADPRRAGQGQAGRHDRRRHQRRAGAGPGRRGDRHEHRHAGGARGRQHGRPRQQPDEAARGGRGRQAAADDPRLPDDLLDRQRRGQVLRDPAGDVHGGVPARSRRST